MKEKLYKRNLEISVVPLDDGGISVRETFTRTFPDAGTGLQVYQKESKLFAIKERVLKGLAIYATYKLMQMGFDSMQAGDIKGNVSDIATSGGLIFLRIALAGKFSEVKDIDDQGVAGINTFIMHPGVEYAPVLGHTPFPEG